MKDCLKCKELDTSDIPNLFCKLTCELVNETDFRYCPKDSKSVVEFIEKLEETHKKEIQELQAKVNELEEGIKNNKTANTSKLVELFDNENKQLKHQLQAQRKQIVKEIEQRACLTHPYDSKTNKSIDIYLVTPEILDNLLKIV